MAASKPHVLDDPRVAERVLEGLDRTLANLKSIRRTLEQAKRKEAQSGR